ncbi:helix-turn-helix domain-containing protein [Sphingobium fuliginis]|uniref:Helix-turn-helix transcriptional regulator n=1 Tax=Sphingobium fuliginis ATCC 27551 TaxID=1208342 RepID=A0A5B8CFP8_SPHSA|nr:helix-turn-helix transcriptional regulator [Sphingobium fuliginis]QDC38388.1 helix-turn-helix transcriptional regulator [Sphingobium fuliginis ATCC 27551]
MSQLIFLGYGIEMTILADRLRDAMGARNMDQKELADAAGCTQGAISQILVGKTQRSRFLPDIAAALGVELDWLRGLTNGDQGAPRAPAVQYFSMKVALPSEAALRDMFRSLLVLVPEGASKDEAAEILARRLPSGLAAIGPLALDPVSGSSTASAEASQFPATDHRASAPSSRT